MKKPKIFTPNFIFKLCFWGFVIACSSLGALIGFILTEIENCFPSYFQNSIIITLFLIIVTIMFSILIHELAHLLKFISMGYKIRLFVLGPFNFCKESNKFKIKFKFNSIIGVGGLVLPDITEIKNINQFTKLKRDYAQAMIIAPIISAIQGLISLLFILFLLPKTNETIHSTLFTIFITSFFSAIYINIISLTNISGAMGDYIAFKAFKYNDTFAAYQLYTYATLSTKKESVRNNSNVIKDILISNFKSECMLKNFDSLTCLIIDLFLYESLSNDIELPNIILKYINYFIENIDSFTSKIPFESYYIMTVHIILYLSKINIEKSKIIWSKVKDKIPNNKIGKYYINQIENIIFNNTTKTNLRDKNNITLSSIDPICCVLDNYYDDEIKLNTKFNIKF